MESFFSTSQYHLFKIFCESVCRDKYIGLCSGIPGVGKTKSARQYASCDRLESWKYQGFPTLDPLVNEAISHCVFYTAPVGNSAGRVERDLDHLFRQRRFFSPSVLMTNQTYEADMADAVRRENREREEWLRNSDPLKPKYFQMTEPTVEQIQQQRSKAIASTKDPVRLLIIDEADQLKLPSLEQIRHIYDQGSFGVIFIGMEGLERKFARYAQLSSRVGFVHAFKSLPEREIRELLRLPAPLDISFPEGSLADDEVATAIVRSVGGNLRLLKQLLRQVARVMEVNKTERATPDIVLAAASMVVHAMN